MGCLVGVRAGYLVDGLARWAASFERLLAVAACGQLPTTARATPCAAGTFLRYFTRFAAVSAPRLGEKLVGPAVIFSGSLGSSR